MKLSTQIILFNMCKQLRWFLKPNMVGLISYQLVGCHASQVENTLANLIAQLMQLKLQFNYTVDAVEAADLIMPIYSFIYMLIYI